MTAVLPARSSPKALPVAAGLTCTGGRGTSMTDICNELQAAHDLAAIGARWAGLLREVYPERHTVKLIARDFGCAERTAASWLAGQAPQAAALARASLLFGPAKVMAVLAPGAAATLIAETEDEVDRLKARLDSLRAALEAL